MNAKKLVIACRHLPFVRTAWKFRGRVYVALNPADFPKLRKAVPSVLFVRSRRRSVFVTHELDDKYELWLDELRERESVEELEKHHYERIRALLAQTSRDYPPAWDGCITEEERWQIEDAMDGSYA